LHSLAVSLSVRGGTLEEGEIGGDITVGDNEGACRGLLMTARSPTSSAAPLLSARMLVAICFPVLVKRTEAEEMGTGIGGWIIEVAPSLPSIPFLILVVISPRIVASLSESSPPNPTPPI